MQKTIEQIKTIHGFTIYGFKDDAITKSLKLKGVYDENTLHSILDITAIFKPEVTLDIGANIGNHALVLSKNSQKVYAFEPVKQVYEVLTKNIETNHLKNIFAYQLAFSNTKGSQVIYLSDTNIGSSSLNAFANSSGQQTINTVIGDDFLNESSIDRIDFIKIDVEGFEGQVIDGLKKTITASRPVILMEWKSEVSRNYFQERVLFETVFSDYQFFSLGHSSSKKAIGRGLVNTLIRLKNKFVGSKWGLYEFTAEKSYSNIYLIPKEKASLLSGWVR